MSTVVNKFIIGVIFLCIVLHTIHSYASREYEIKAAFIGKFIPFIEWPNKKTAEKKILIMGIVGNNPFPQETLVNLERNQFQGKKLNIIELLDDITSIQRCDIIFISSDQGENIANILELLKGLPILTIADSNGLAEKGVMINFLPVDNRIRFEMNKKMLDTSKIKASYKLLTLANKIY